MSIDRLRAEKIQRNHDTGICLPEPWMMAQAARRG
jgi:hypothetical protein